MLVPELDKKGKKTGKFIKSPYANPFMDYDMMPHLTSIPDSGFVLPFKEGSDALDYDKVIPVLLGHYFPTGVLGLGLTGLGSEITRKYSFRIAMSFSGDKFSARLVNAVRSTNRILASRDSVCALISGPSLFAI